jgi:hypothetical protein
MTEPTRQPGDEFRAGDKVAHRHMPGRVGRVDEVLKRGDRFFPLDVDPGIDRVAWVKWEARDCATSAGTVHGGPLTGLIGQETERMGSARERAENDL